MLVDDGGDVARVVREHDAVGADVLRPRTRRARRAAFALGLRRAAACAHTHTPSLIDIAPDSIIIWAACVSSDAPHTYFITENE